uniref:Uncharacterized protein n=1 Tax=Lepeophtheirus salmonis TaxID=72036 RepID=A0A0K2TAM4_LEPSM
MDICCVDPFSILTIFLMLI